MTIIGDRVAALTHEIAHGSRIDAATTSAHDQTVERREPHGRVHVLTVFDGREGCAGAKVKIGRAHV